MEQVRKIAEIATKGPVMIRSMDLFESAVFAPQASFGGEYLHKDFFQQAAALMRSLAENQPLVDGNKRTAWLSVVTFAELNGWTIEATEDQVVDLMVHLASRNADPDHIARWLRDRASAI